MKDHLAESRQKREAVRCQLASEKSAGGFITTFSIINSIHFESNISQTCYYFVISLG